MGWNQIPLHRLDPDSRRYLKSVATSQGEGGNGVFAADPSKVWGTWVWFFGALLILGVSFFQASQRPQATLVLIQIPALLVLVQSGLRILRVRRRQRQFAGLCHLKWIDGRGIWWTNDEILRFLPHSDLFSVQPQHCRSHGTYRFTNFEMATKCGPTRMRVFEEEKAEAFFQYSKAMRGVLDLVHQQKGSRRNDAALLGMLAARMQSGCEDLAKGGRIPGPRAAQGRARQGWQAPFWAIGVAVFLLGMNSIPATNQFLYQQRLYQLTQSPHAKVYDCNHYLEEFPEGRHLMQVLETRDAIFFADAMEIAERESSPAALRAYLTDTLTWKHRPEVQERIDRFYDEAMATLRDSSDVRERNPELFGGMVALLERLKQRLEPRVGVEFVAGFQELPKGASAIRESAVF